MVSQAWKGKFNPEDMSVKEVDFVRDSYQVEPETYCQIKDRIWSEMVAQAHDEGMKQARADAKNAAKTELRHEVTSELKPSITAEVEKTVMLAAVKKAKEELEPQLRRTITDELRAEWQKGALTDADRKSYSAALRDIEVESITFATAASEEADSVGKDTQKSRTAAHSLLAASLIGAGPFTYWLMGSRDPSSIGFWLLGLPYIVLLIYAVIFALPPGFGSDGNHKPQTTATLRRTSSDYLSVASRARILRNLNVNTHIRSDVQDEFNALLRSKTALDESYRPSVDLVESVKHRVRVSLTDEIDPEKLMADEFDDRIRQQERKSS